MPISPAEVLDAMARSVTNTVLSSVVTDVCDVLSRPEEEDGYGYDRSHCFEVVQTLVRDPDKFAEFLDEHGSQFLNPQPPANDDEFGDEG